MRSNHDWRARPLPWTESFLHAVIHKLKVKIYMRAAQHSFCCSNQRCALNIRKRRFHGRFWPPPCRNRNKVGTTVSRAMARAGRASAGAFHRSLRYRALAALLHPSRVPRRNAQSCCACATSGRRLPAYRRKTETLLRAKKTGRRRRRTTAVRVPPAPLGHGLDSRPLGALSTASELQAAGAPLAPRSRFILLPQAPCDHRCRALCSRP